jgi:hypothetical protein
LAVNGLAARDFSGDFFSGQSFRSKRLTNHAALFVQLSINLSSRYVVRTWTIADLRKGQLVLEIRHMIRQDWLIYFNFALIVGVAIYFWRGRPKDRTTRLNLGKSDGRVGPQVLSQARTGQGPFQAQERQLGVIFNFNGHQWEAYQVLGLPAGADLPTCREAERKLTAEDPSDIYRLAVEAIAANQGRESN